MNVKPLGHTFSLLHVAHVRLDSKWNYAKVMSPYFRIYYIDSGEGYINSEKEKVRLEKGFLYIIPSFTLCHLYCEHRLSQYFLHFFEDAPGGVSLFEFNRHIIKVAATRRDIDNFTRLLEINPNRGINRSDDPKVYEKNSFYRHYQQLNEHASDAFYLETQGIICQLIARFLGSRQFVSPHHEPIPQKILETIHYIQSNLKTRLTVTSLAKRANLHPDYFSTLFLQATGERPLAYIQIKRIERAQYLLAASPLTHTQIAGELGFDNPPYFFRLFKKLTGLTPGQYLKSTRFVK